jgi:DNA-binding protein HU-beta
MRTQIRISDGVSDIPVVQHILDEPVGKRVRNTVTPNRGNDISVALFESARRQQVAAREFPKEIEMPPAKKPATAAKKAPASVKVAATAKKAASLAKAATTAKKAAAPVKAAAKKVPAVAKKAAAPARKAVATKAAPQVTITLKQIAATLAESHEMPKRQAEAMLGDLVALATQHLQKGDKIRLTGLGILQVRARPARMGRNPATGESIKIAASKKIAFRPAKELKESV